MIRIVTALALASATTTPVVPPDTTACLERKEAVAVFQAMLPAFIEGAASRCSSVLPPEAFLRAGAVPFAERLRRENKFEPGILSAALSKAAGTEMPAGISDTTVLMLTNDVAKTMLVQELRDENCQGINEMIEAVSPLPARNITMLLSGLMTVLPEGTTNTGFRICTAEQDG
jgi:hypothetical protein